MTAEHALGPLRVRVDPARAAAFARETGFPAASGRTPLSYAAVWLTEPCVREVVARLCAESDSVPLHETQRFEYEASLRAGVDYALFVSIRRDETPPRLTIGARLATQDDVTIGRFETLLRLAPRAALQGKREA
jgi:hypothetical protein